MYSRAELLRPTLAMCGALALFGMAALAQYRQWGASSPSAVAVALAGCGMALTLMAGALWQKMVQTHQMEVLTGERLKSRVPFWIAEAAPFERPPRR